MNNDLISRQAALEEIQGLYPPKVADESEAEAINRVGWECAINCIEAYLRTVKPAQQWIPCSERLPEEIGSYPVWTARGFGDHFSTSYWDGKEWNLRVVAWMPLPEPYKGGKDVSITD